MNNFIGLCILSSTECTGLVIRARKILMNILRGFDI